MAKLIPTKKTLFQKLKVVGEGALYGGIPSAIAIGMTGSIFWGELLGSLVGASIAPPHIADIIAVSGAKDAVESLVIGGLQ
jgi:hypothetical protein